MSTGIEEIGVVQWQVALCLLLAWTLTFLALSKGVKSVGKASSSISQHSCLHYLWGTRNMGVRSVGSVCTFSKGVGSVGNVCTLSKSVGSVGNVSNFSKGVRSVGNVCILSKGVMSVSVWV